MILVVLMAPVQVQDQLKKERRGAKKKYISKKKKYLLSLKNSSSRVSQSEALSDSCKIL